MGKCADSEAAFEFAIDAAKKIEIELRGDAAAVVIGGDQCPDVLAQVDPDDRLAAFSDMLTHPAKQGVGFGSAEIAQRRPRKKCCARMGGYVGGDVKIGGEVGDDRTRREIGKPTPNALRRLREKIRRDIDRHVHPWRREGRR